MSNKASTSKCSRVTSNKEWISKEQFYDVYPKGYRECNFFSSPVECWAMSKDACRNQTRTAFLDLSWYLDKQRELQQTSFIGHSSDTELLTELLQNNKNSINNNVQTQNNTNSINNYVNLNSDIFLTQNANFKKCYTCNNVCKCSRLLPTKLNKHLRGTNNETVALLSQARLVLPEIELIDTFDKVSIKSSMEKTILEFANNSINNNDVSVSNNAMQNISDNCYDTLETDFDIESIEMFENNNRSLFNLDTSDNIQSSSTNQLDNRVIVTERTTGQIIHEESMNQSITNENDEYDKISLKYFYLNSISDIFQDIQDDCTMMM